MMKRQRGFLLNPFRFGGGSDPSDSDFASVSLLLHGEGANGGTTITDSSGNAFTPNSATSVTTISLDSVFGSSSLQLAGASSSIIYTGHAEFLMTADFTVDMQMKVPDRTNCTFFVLRESEAAGRTVIFTNASGQVQYNRFGQATQTFNASTTIVPVDTWFYAQVKRSGSTITFSIDASSIGTATDSATLGNGTGGIGIGGHTWAGNQLIDEVRVTKSVARATAIQTAPWPNHA